MITILIPYGGNRPEALARLLSIVNELPTTRFVIDVVTIPLTEDGLFNSGHAQNIGFSRATTDWIFKNDVDCTMPLEHYYYLEMLTKQSDWTDYWILGVDWLLDTTPSRIRPGIGNEYLVHWLLWRYVGGCPSWDGYGWEDYAFEYIIEKATNPRFRLSEYNARTITQRIRDELTKIKNADVPFHMTHHAHPPAIRSGNMSIVAKNRTHLWNLVRRIEGI